MIRRKLLLLLGSLIALWVVAAIVAIVLLDGVLKEIDVVREIVFDCGIDAIDTAAAVNEVDLILIRMAMDEQVSAETIQAAAANLAHVESNFARTDLIGFNSQELAQVVEVLTLVRTEIERLSKVPPNGEVANQAKQVLAASIALHSQISDFNTLQQNEIQARQHQLATQFRSVALGLGIAYMVLINGSLLLFLRVSMMILRPVERLVEATHRLGNEEYDYRVEIDQKDEFDELARAYNSLAEQLQNNEERRLEVLHQVATTLNHELNNAFAVIDVQLHLVERTESGQSLNPDSFRQIHQTLERMQGTINALKRIRRIVLTDYAAGIRMLDLQRSTEDDESTVDAAVLPLSDPLSHE